MDKYSYIANAHGAYLDEVYESYKEDPNSVDVSWQRFFEGFDFSLEKYGEDGEAMPVAGGSGNLHKEIKVRQLIDAYRSRGHLQSKTNPVRERKDRKALLELSDFNLSDKDLDTVFEAGNEIGIGPAKLKDIVAALKKIYEGAIGFEFMSIREPETLEWFKNKVESEYLNFNPSIDKKKRILSKLNEAVVFENFLHTKYIGQKRFSLEGGESAIPALDAIINKSSELGAEEVIIGMAHRGRLNVLTNIMGKTYAQIFNEFEGNTLPDASFGDGDVKYHLGFSSQITTTADKQMTLNLVPNPSHLEAVNPVVLGYARAESDTNFEGDTSKIIPILIHGDAAVAGQGIVYEVVQMSKLNGYNVGGTIHFIINNQVGFTTDFDDARSSIYCTDISQIIEAPELHVNGDDPEAVMFAVQLAVEFRQKYKRDIFIDLVCYRRHGHNEADEPKFTQPKLYNSISKHPNPREIYSKMLAERGEVDANLAKSMDRDFRKTLQDRLNEVRQKPLPYEMQPLEKEWEKLRFSTPDDFLVSPDTSISEGSIEKVAKALTSTPENFKPIKQISDRVLKERKKLFFEEKTLNWAAAELLAYGSILEEGKTVRMTGQDVIRGTFSHRHAGIRDAETNEPYNFLANISEDQGKFEIYNSLLSEYGVLGFEFGYACTDPNALVIWEAQFGDFSNGAQVMIDQFITSCESKWQRMAGLVMLLPHGYEGQGPEHSSARPERYLQQAAEFNIVVANLTTPANIFHLMRRQLAWEFRKPSIVMSPKSLLRHPKVMSPISEFTDGKFRETYGDDNVKAKNVKRALICSGKIYFDLLEYQENEGIEDTAIIRVEQLHPFPAEQVDAELVKYKNLETTVWVQEEPINMGYWTFVNRTYRHNGNELELVARKPSASPATGYKKQHEKEQAYIVETAFKK